MSDAHEDEVREFREFLANTTPEDFQRSSTINVSPSNYHGTGGFERFIIEHTENAKAIYNEEEGAVDPIIILANDDEVRDFEAYHDETMLDMFTRLHREAQTMQATMVFVAMTLYAANTALDLDGLDSDAVREAIERGDVSPFFGWYAEYNPPNGERIRKSGLWEIEQVEERDARYLGEHTLGTPQVAPLFHSILE